MSALARTGNAPRRPAAQARPRAARAHTTAPGTQPAALASRPQAPCDRSPVRETESWSILHLNPGAEELIVEVWGAAVARGSAFAAGDAVFTRVRPSVDVAVYFTPGAKRLARMFGAVRCRRPRAAGLVQLLGDARAGPLHYPQWPGCAPPSPQRA